jgi:hypothetical protein
VTMNHRLLLVTAVLALAASSACGGDVTTGSGGGSGSGTGGSTSLTTGTGGSPSTTTGSGGSPSTTTGTGGAPSTTTGTGGSGGGILYCTDNSTDPNACPFGQKCLCGGPGGGIVCECGFVCASDADCTNPDQPLCCGGGGGQQGVCTSSCTCLCD